MKNNTNPINALTEIRGALKSFSTVENDDTCLDDKVSRSFLIKEIQTLLPTQCDDKQTKYYKHGLIDAIEIIKYAPSIGDKL